MKMNTKLSMPAACGTHYICTSQKAFLTHESFILPKCVIDWWLCIPPICFLTACIVGQCPHLLQTAQHLPDCSSAASNCLPKVRLQTRQSICWNSFATPSILLLACVSRPRVLLFLHPWPVNCIAGIPCKKNQICFWGFFFCYLLWIGRRPKGWYSVWRDRVKYSVAQEDSPSTYQKKVRC